MFHCSISTLEWITTWNKASFDALESLREHFLEQNQQNHEKEKERVLTYVLGRQPTLCLGSGFFPVYDSFFMPKSFVDTIESVAVAAAIVVVAFVAVAPTHRKLSSLKAHDL